MSPRSASHKPRQAYRHLTNTEMNIRPIATSHLVPFMGPIMPA